MFTNAKESVLEKYSEGAKERQESLCCPVSYDAGLLSILPDEIIEKDYGCGDPSRYVQEGDVVVIRYDGPKGGPGMREMYTAMKLIYGRGLVYKTALVTDGRF